VRGEIFVTQKITRGIARIKLGLQDCLYLGNLNTKRGWGHAGDYVEAQWLVLQQKNPENFVIASGQQYSVRDLFNVAVSELGVRLEWRGKNLKETGIVSQVDGSGKTDPRKGPVIVRVDPRYFHPTEVESLFGDATKARKKLGWKPKIKFKELVTEMMREDMKAAERNEIVKRHGYSAYDYHE